MTNDPLLLDLDARKRLVRGFLGQVPHNQALDITITDVSDARCSMVLPYRDDLVGDPESGVLHGGAITTLIDSACGASVFMGMARAMPVATLDLRIDYLRPAMAGQPVHAHAHCYTITRSVAFVRCEAVQADGRVVAHGAGTFMVGTRRGKHRDAVKDLVP